MKVGEMMLNFIKKIYRKIICYDPIIEQLYICDDSSEENYNYFASPVIINRKTKRKIKSAILLAQTEGK